jgi:hypothetical protein
LSCYPEKVLLKTFFGIWFALKYEIINTLIFYG